MSEQTSGVTGLRRVLRSPKCRKGLNISSIVFGFVCIGGCFIMATLTYVLFGDCEDCEANSTKEAMVKYFRILATALFLVGILFIALSLCCRGSENRMSPQVVISTVPDGDLEKSPAPMLPYNHTPHRDPFARVPPLELPNESFIMVENLDEVGPSSVNVNAGFWSEDLDGPVTPPPTYEQALEMIQTTFSASEANSQSSER